MYNINISNQSAVEHSLNFPGTFSSPSLLRLICWSYIMQCLLLCKKLTHDTAILRFGIMEHTSEQNGFIINNTGFTNLGTIMMERRWLHITHLSYENRSVLLWSRWFLWNITRKISNNLSTATEDQEGCWVTILIFSQCYFWMNTVKLITFTAAEVLVLIST